jgi:DNA-binding transcriptional regulator GbsR (MarR family)
MGQEERRPAETALLDRLVSTLEAAGFPRPLARVYAALMLAEGEGLSTSELMARLDISKASITNAMQLLLSLDLAERYRVRGSREAHYRILKGKWGPIMARKFSGIAMVRRTAADALATAPSEAARERLQEMYDVYSFFEQEFDGIMARWNARAEEEK